MPCPAGTFQELSGQFHCTQCPKETYAELTGTKKCIACPFRLSSTEGSTDCSFCSKDFYLKDSSVPNLNLFQNPSQYCLDCPSNAKCPANTTLQTIVIEPGFWRDSVNTSTIYECESDTVCLGSQMDVDNENYCSQGLTGLLCEVCDNEKYYFDRNDNTCLECPSLVQIILRFLFFALLVIVAIIIVTGVYNNFFPLTISGTKISFQAKLKVLISFYQMVLAFQEDSGTSQGIYSIQLDSNFTAWFDFLRIFSFDILDWISIPLKCIGPVRSQILFLALWPLVFVIIVIVLNISGRFISKRFCNTCNEKVSRHLVLRNVERGNSSDELVFSRLFNFGLLVMYVMLPIVSATIFQAINCQAYQTVDFPQPAFTIYLLADPTIECNIDDGSFSNLQDVFWIVFILGPVLLPTIFIIVLMRARESVRINRITPLAESCRFLWGDYTPSMMFWDVGDTIRKIILSGIILFLDREEGSTKIFRLVVATIISCFYLVLLAFAQPYKNLSDFYLALLSNSVLVCCFGLGLILYFCNENDEEDTCRDTVGVGLDSYSATLVVVVLTIFFGITTVLSLMILTVNIAKSPTVTLISTNEAPNLELPYVYKYHAFLSYSMATAEQKSKLIALRLMQFLPGMNIYFEGDQMHGFGKLRGQEEVTQSVVFIMFYSTGYFWSKRCYEELRAALEAGKPILLMYEGYESETLKAIRNECIKSLKGKPEEAKEILEAIFTIDPINWQDDGTLHAKCLNLIYYQILRQLPYYLNDESDLQAGIMVPGQLIDIKVKNTTRVFVCYEYNSGVVDIIDKLYDSENRTRAATSRLFIECVDVSIRQIFSKNNNNNEEKKDEVHEATNSEDKVEEVKRIISKQIDSDKDDKSIKKCFLLYLNDQVFLYDKGDVLFHIVKAMLDLEVELILVHEINEDYPMNQVVSRTPEELVSKYRIYEKHSIVNYYPSGVFNDASAQEIFVALNALK